MGKKRLSIKQIESYLQDIDDFDEPKIQLEQYATPPHIAAQMLNIIDETYGDIEAKSVADLGCGTGRLAIGSVLCGAGMVLGFDIDPKALEGGLNNVRDIFGESDDESEDAKFHGEGPILCSRGCERINFVLADIASKNWDNFWDSMGKRFDTVIMNPPFGTKQAQGLDMLFLKRAIDLTENTVYSLHKTSTRDFIANKCQQWGVVGKPIAKIRYNLDNTYKFHRKKNVDIDVDLWQIKSFSQTR